MKTKKISMRQYKIETTSGKYLFANTKEELDRKLRSIPSSWGHATVSRHNVGALIKRLEKRRNK